MGNLEFWLSELINCAVVLMVLGLVCALPVLFFCMLAKQCEDAQKAHTYWREKFADDVNSDNAMLLRASGQSETQAELLRPTVSGASEAPPQELLRAGVKQSPTASATDGSNN